MTADQGHAVPSGADFLLLEPSARAAAVGGAFTAQQGLTDGLRYNPAALAGLKGAGASMSHASAPGDWSHDWAGAGLQWGGIGLGAEVLVSSLKPFELYDINGNAVGLAGAGSQNLMLAAATRLSGTAFSLGGGLRVFRSQLHTFTSQGYAADFGLLLGKPDGPFSAGLALQNLGAQSAYIADADPLPLSLRTGLLSKLPLDQGLDVHPSLDLVLFMDPTRPLEVRAGIEAQLFKAVGLRAGLQQAGSYRQLSFGLGFLWQGWGLDYAFQPGTELGAAHMIEIHLVSGR